MTQFERVRLSLASRGLVVPASVHPDNFLDCLYTAALTAAAVKRVVRLSMLVRLGWAEKAQPYKRKDGSTGYKVAKASGKGFDYYTEAQLQAAKARGQKGEAAATAKPGAAAPKAAKQPKAKAEPKAKPPTKTELKLQGAKKALDLVARVKEGGALTADEVRSLPELLNHLTVAQTQQLLAGLGEKASKAGKALLQSKVVANLAAKSMERMGQKGEPKVAAEQPKAEEKTVAPAKEEPAAPAPTATPAAQPSAPAAEEPIEVTDADIIDEPAAQQPAAATPPAAAKPAQITPEQARKPDKATLQDSIKSAYNHLTLFKEYKDGLVELPHLHDELKKVHPEMTVEDFHAAVNDLWDSEQFQPFILNEVKDLSPEDRALSIDKDDHLYHYLMPAPQHQEPGGVGWKGAESWQDRQSKMQQAVSGKAAAKPAAPAPGKPAAPTATPAAAPATKKTLKPDRAAARPTPTDPKGHADRLQAVYETLRDHSYEDIEKVIGDVAKLPTDQVKEVAKHFKMHGLGRSKGDLVKAMHHRLSESKGRQERGEVIAATARRMEAEARQEAAAKTDDDVIELPPEAVVDEPAAPASKPAPAAQPAAKPAAASPGSDPVKLIADLHENVRKPENTAKRIERTLDVHLPNMDKSHLTELAQALNISQAKGASAEKMRSLIRERVSGRKGAHDRAMSGSLDAAADYSHNVISIGAELADGDITEEQARKQLASIATDMGTNTTTIAKNLGVPVSKDRKAMVAGIVEKAMQQAKQVAPASKPAPAAQPAAKPAAPAPAPAAQKPAGEQGETDQHGRPVGWLKGKGSAAANRLGEMRVMSEKFARDPEVGVTDKSNQQSKTIEDGVRSHVAGMSKDEVIALAKEIGVVKNVKSKQDAIDEIARKVNEPLNAAMTYQY